MNKKQLRNQNINHAMSYVVELPFGLGDQIMCFPLFASLKKAMPQSKITVLSPNKNSTLILSKNKYIDNIYEYGLKKFTYVDVLKFFLREFSKLWLFFKNNSFDIFIIIHPNPFRTLLSKLLPYKKLLINNEHTHKTKEVVNILKMLGMKPVYDYKMEIKQQKEILSRFNLNKNNYFLLDIYAQHLSKDPRQWPYFEDLIFELQKKQKNIVIAGLNPTHKHRSEIIDVVNRTSLEELLYIIKNAKFVIAMDSGIFHFSYSLKTPVVGLFGPVNPEDRIPFNKKLKVKVIYNNKNCSPCIINKVQIECKNTKDKYSCMTDIKVDEVMKKIEEVL
jgi:ADP-heptose:LPS heptosyltransferase